MNGGRDITTITEKFIKGRCSREELDAAISLFSDPYHNLELHPILFEYWNNEDFSGYDDLRKEELAMVLDQIHHRINLEQEKDKTKEPQKTIVTVLMIAAVLVVGLLLGISIQHLKKTEPVYYTSIAPRGSVSQLVLPDNTMVFLNAGSEIKYAAGNGKQREVFLNGEGWFDVAENEKIPFVVHTPFYDICVLGTQFNVKAYKTDQEIVTTLEKGKVQITSSENLKMKEEKTLDPGEQLIFYTQKKAVEIKEVNTRMFTSWKDNKLIFINMNLKELIVLLERKYGVDIEITDNVILDYHYDGTIKDETILEVLDLLKETLPVKYRIEGQTILITK